MGTDSKGVVWGVPQHTPHNWNNSSHATSKVERAFSLLNRIKTDWRIYLNTATVEDLMIISLEGPEEEEFAESAVKKWFRSGKKAKRPHIKPYGER